MKDCKFLQKTAHNNKCNTVRVGFHSINMILRILDIFVAKSCGGNYSNREIFRCDIDDREIPLTLLR